MPEHDNDRLEQFFRKAASKPDVSFNEADWEKLEARLDAQNAIPSGASKPGRKIATASAVTAVLLLSLMVWVNSGDDLSPASEPVSSASPAGSAESDDDDLVRGKNNADGISDVTRSNGNDDNRGEAPVGASETVLLNAQGSSDEAAGETNDSRAIAANEHGGVTGAQAGIMAAGGDEKNERSIPDKVVDMSDQQILKDLIKIATASAGKNKQKAIVELPGAEEVEPSEAESMVREEHASDQEDHVATPRLSLLLSFAPDFSGTSLGRYSTPGRAFGAMLRYHLTDRWSLSAGAIKNNKRYTGEGEEYNPPNGYWKYYTNGKIPTSIDGSCSIMEFPIMLQYTVVRSGRNMLVAGAGASSYLMWDESYRYHFDAPNPGAKDGWESESRSRFMFNMINFTVGYERHVMPGLMVGIQPYVKIPVEEIGWSNLKLFSSGASLTVRYVIFQKRYSFSNRSRGPD